MAELRLVRRYDAHMRTKTIAVLVVIVSALFSACNRPSDSGEVQRLREEVERLKSAQPLAPPAATSAAESPDYQNFLRVARRLMTAIESGVSFQDFHERAVEVLASAKEASRSAPTAAKQKAIATFAIAIIDANDLWSCEGDSDLSGQYLRYDKDKNGSLRRHYGDVFHPCGRWDHELPKLDTAYKLDAYSNDGSFALVRIDSALKNIFKVCADTFAILESPQ